MRETYFHGTRRGFTKGGVLVPRSMHGGDSTTAPLLSPGDEGDAAEWVYMTLDPVLAWVYAWHAPGRGRPKVLVVEPSEEPQPDPEHSGEMLAFRARSARVVAVLTRPLINEREAREGWAC